jgi:predicted amidohydrolase YtcJ
MPLQAERRAVGSPPRPGQSMAARLTTYLVVGIVAATLIAGLIVGAQRDDSDGPVDLIVFNGKVYTADGSGTMAEAVAVRGNQILRVGSNREINRLRRPQTVLIDANGAAVVPGFEDTSTHFIDGGMALDEVDLTDATTVEEIQARIQAWATTHPDRPWIIGRGWQASVFGGGPTHQLLDAVTADRPAYLVSADGRSAWLNLKALERAGITKRSATPPDGLIVKESRTGQPSGLLKGSAIALASKALPRASRDERERALHAAIEEAHRQGVTSVHDTIDRSDDFILYDDARQAGELAIRVYASVAGDGVAEAELFKELESLSSAYPDDPLFKMGGVRLAIDGGVEALDAAVLEPYQTRPDYSGPNRVDPDALNRLVRLLDARGFQITLAASGDRAVRMALDAFEHAERSNKKEPEKGRRHRIEGVELVDAVDVPRFARLRTIAAICPDDMSPTSERREAWERSVGSERASRAWPAGSLVSARGQLAFGTGWPTHPMNLFGAMQTAVTRATADGRPDGGWAAAERVSVKRAVNAFTSVPAYLSFDEQRKGSLKKGMLADLVVLTTDIFDAPGAELSRASVAATIFDGKIVYQRNAKSTN